MNNKLQSLKAIAEAKVEGFQKATYFKIHPSKLEFEVGFNLRTEGAELEAHIEQLYLAMKAGAQVPPIDVTVEDGRTIVRDGHCRTRAAKRLLAEGIEYLLEARHFRGNEADCVFHMLGTANGKNLSPLEVGMGYKRLTAYGMDISAIAARAGVSRSTVENGVKLAEAPMAVHKMIASGQVASSAALKVLKKEGGRKAVDTLEASLKVAKESGKAKVTGKHLPKAKEPNYKLIVADLMAAMERLACLGNGDQWGNSDGNRIAIDAITQAKASGA